MNCCSALLLVNLYFMSYLIYALSSLKEFSCTALVWGWNRLSFYAHLVSKHWLIAIYCTLNCIIVPGTFTDLKCETQIMLMFLRKCKTASVYPFILSFFPLRHFFLFLSSSILSCFSLKSFLPIFFFFSPFFHSFFFLSFLLCLFLPIILSFFSLSFPLPFPLKSFCFCRFDAL